MNSFWRASGRRDCVLAKLVRPPAVHAYAFDPSNADKLDADIVAAVLLIGEGNELFRRGIQVIALADKVGYLRCG